MLAGGYEKGKRGGSCVWTHGIADTGRVFDSIQGRISHSVGQSHGSVPTLQVQECSWSFPAAQQHSDLARTWSTIGPTPEPGGFRLYNAL